jgi:molybdenum cofactor cytidylyltransferase
MTAAIILAAGRAARMGTNKLVLPLGPVTVVGRVLTTALVACDWVVVVIGLHDQPTRTVVEQTTLKLGAADRVELVTGVRYDPGMFISVQAGLRHVGTPDAVLIFPGDVPLISSATAVAVRDAVLRGGSAIAVPESGGHKGHPVAFAARCVPELLAMSERSTMRHYMEDHAADITLVHVEDPTMLLDLDTPEDYEHVVQSLNGNGTHSREV